MENIYTYVQFEGMIYQQIVGIPMGTNCAQLIADLLSSRNSVGEDIVTRLFVGGWVSESVSGCVGELVGPSRFTLWTR